MSALEQGILEAENEIKELVDKLEKELERLEKASTD
jgi:hypothetical protein